jgi:predicted ATPase
MFTEWTIENFKSIFQETTVLLTPLTIFTGEHNVGKSAFLQTILLVAQTLSSKQDGIPAFLNGELVNLGSFNHIKTYYGSKDTISLGWGYSTPGVGETSATLDFLARFSLGVDPKTLKSASDFDLADLPLRLKKFSVCASASISKDNKRDEINISRINNIYKKVKDIKSQINNFEIVNNLIKDSLKPLNYNVKITGNLSKIFGGPFLVPLFVGCYFTNFLPRKLIAIIDPHKEISNLFYLALTDPKIDKTIYNNKNYGAIKFPVQLIEALKDNLGVKFNIFSDNMPLNEFSLSDFMKGLRRLAPNKRAEIYDTFLNIKDLKSLIIDIVNDDDALCQAALPAVFDVAKENGQLRPFIKEYAIEDSYFSSIANIASIKFKYLRAMRAEPKVVCPLYSQPNNLDIGLNGERTTNVLYHNQRKCVNYIPPTVFKLNNAPIKIESTPLIEAVSDWFYYLGLGDDVFVYDRGRYGLELKVALDGAPERDITQVGLGVSQVLPVLVMGLLAERNEVLIFDRPELNLHPQAQVRLADFFLSLIILGKNCLIETHSEHLINHLRLRIIKEETSQIVQDNLTLYFVHKRRAASNFQEVIINKYGAIPDGPKYFFSEVEDEFMEIMRAVTEKINKERIQEKEKN